jgi:hypothetical protein
MPVTGLPFGRPLTIEDLESMPDVGHRYVLLDGTLLLSPAPAWSHQDVVGRTYLALMEACVPVTVSCSLRLRSPLERATPSCSPTSWSPGMAI